MRTRLQKSEETAFQRQTELDLFVQVLELRVEEATGSLQAERSELQARVVDLQTQLDAQTGRLSRAADALKALATRPGLAAQRPTLDLTGAREALASLERSLSETADELPR